jgi:peptidoglycan/LPS O-acetylase OafA/YrhL
MLRGLCALEIAGLHWLRACMHVGLFTNTNVPESFRNFIWSYKNNNQGFQMLHNFPSYFLLDSHTNNAAALTNALGFLFGFGWQAVNVFILLSGFSLTLKLTDWPDKAKAYWLDWYKRRFRRILLPYYLIVVIVISSFCVLYLTISLLHIPFFDPIQNQLQDRINRDWISILFSNIFLVNPWAPQWIPTFFTSAWWFIPAILVAYLFFPLYFWLLLKLGTQFFLVSTCLVTVTAYWLETKNILSANTWYFVVLLESFNFALGMVIGRCYQKERSRIQLEQLLFNQKTFLLGILLVFSGDLIGWFTFLYPLSSVAFTCGLMIVGANLSSLLLQVRFVRQLKKIDFYILYLIHQPFAYLLALFLSHLLHSYTTFIGIFVYLFVVLSFTSIFVKTYTLIEKKCALWLHSKNGI